MNSRFILLNKTYSLIEYIEDKLVNYSKKMNVLKDKMEACVNVNIKMNKNGNLSLYKYVK